MNTTSLQEEQATQRDFSQDFQGFKTNMDSWVKFFNNKLDVMRDFSLQIVETADNSNHNYELIKEVREDIEMLRQELRAIKLMQVLMLDKQTKKSIITASRQQ